MSTAGTKRARRAHTFATIALLVVVATAMALLLAQSAGALHLGVLGPVG
jgi:hypothetical protein